MKKVTIGKNLMFEGENIRFFRDYPAEMVKKRALLTKGTGTGLRLCSGG